MNDSLVVLRLPPRLADEVAILMNRQEVFDSDVIDIQIKARDVGGASSLPVQEFLPADVGAALRAALPDMKDVSGIEAGLSLWGTRLPSNSNVRDLDGVFDLDQENLPNILHRLRVERAHAAGAKSDQASISYRCVNAPDHYAFRILDVEYHATRVKLPTVIEAHRGSEDMLRMYMAGDVKEELVVSDVPLSEPRPAPKPTDNDGSSGLTTFMHDAQHKRIEPTTPQSRREAAGIESVEDVRRADKRLSEYKALLAQKLASTIASSKKSGVNTEFVLETWIDMPGWVAHLPPDSPSVIVLSYEDADDEDPVPFRHVTRKVQEVAMAHAAKLAAKKAKEAQEAAKPKPDMYASFVANWRGS